MKKGNKLQQSITAMFGKKGGGRQPLKRNTVFPVKSSDNNSENGSNSKQSSGMKHKNSGKQNSNPSAKRQRVGKKKGAAVKSRSEESASVVEGQQQMELESEDEEEEIVMPQIMSQAAVMSSVIRQQNGADLVKGCEKNGSDCSKDVNQEAKVTAVASSMRAKKTKKRAVILSTIPFNTPIPETESKAPVAALQVNVKESKEPAVAETSKHVQVIKTPEKSDMSDAQKAKFQKYHIRATELISNAKSQRKSFEEMKANAIMSIVVPCPVEGDEFPDVLRPTLALLVEGRYVKCSFS